MKTYIVSLIVLVSVSFVSCDAFLEEDVYSNTFAEGFYTTEANAESALTGVYSTLNVTSIQGKGNQPLWGRGMHFMMMHGDEIVGNLTSISSPTFKEIASMSYSAGSELVGEVWFALYAGIDRCNYLIKYVPGIEMDAVRRDQIVAEARFFRGFFELYLTWLFGAIPLQKEPSDISLNPRSSVQDVYEAILSDLDYAYRTLPDRNVRKGRINKWTAAGFMIKAYTYLAACKENNVGESLLFGLNSFQWVNASECYEKAEVLAEDLIAHSEYVMTTPVYNCFLADTKTEQKKECLMVVQAGPEASGNYYLFSYLTGPQGSVNADGGCYGWIRPLGELCSRYHTVDNRFYWNIQGNTGGATATQSIGGVKYYRPYAVNATGNNLCLTKFRQSEAGERTKIGMPTWASNIDFPILRVSDILLLYAEAKYKNGDESGARELLKEVRTRACTNGTIVDESALATLTSVYNRTDFMEELMDERSRELCGEGWRRIDLIRMGKFVSVIRNLDTTASNAPYYYYNRNTQTLIDNVGTGEHKIWYPIPKREISTNPNLVPNP